jgi:hypothetical protein
MERKCGPSLAGEERLAWKKAASLPTTIQGVEALSAAGGLTHEALDLPTVVKRAQPALRGGAQTGFDNPPKNT